MTIARTLTLALLMSSTALAQSPEDSSTLTLERIFDAPPLSGPSLRQAKLSPDGTRVTFLRGRQDDGDTLDLWEYNLDLEQTRRLISADDVLAEPAALSDAEKARRERARISGLRGIVEYRWARNGRHILFPLGGDIFLADLESSPIKIRQLTAGDAFDLDPKISPDAASVAFIRDQDLWAVDVEAGKVRALTDDGEGPVKNGMAEFIAQEEMGRSTGYWWSPDGSAIAFLQIDESPIEPSERYEVSGEKIEIIEQRYPYAGTPNVRYRLGVVELESGETDWIPLGEEQDIYIPRVDWLPDGSGLSFQRQSRDQQHLDLVLHDLETGRQRVLVSEHSDTWINLHDDLHFLEGMSAFIWSSERSGFRHLYLVGLDGEIIRPLTEGRWPVGALAAVDEDLGLVYFTAGIDTPAERHLYRQSLATATPEAVQRVSRRDGWHEITFAASGRTYLDTFSSTAQPPQLSLHSADGERLAWLVENRVDAGHPYAPFMPGHRPTEFGVIEIGDEAEDGQPLHYRMIKPTGFDESETYPVFLHVYGGPTSRMVVNEWGRRHLVDQYMARSGYIVFSLDNRGIEGQGVEFQAPADLNLGQVEVEDQMFGVEFLKTQPFVDPERIGVFGWSYGGYMTLMMLMQHPGEFAAGAAVAPVTDWALYDTHYTERYLGMPRTDSGAPTEAYTRANVLEYAEKLADPLLLIHGMADDNVLFTHSTMLMQRLQSAAIDFELMTYPGEKHAISGEGQRLHVYRQIDRFFRREVRGTD
ncbi:MAG TPA: S9 family peptidase [Wenzhouxiangellaceae bacterium]|nr:S9 family peptidase [Wenzhouxiangellaceae bacterium]